MTEAHDDRWDGLALGHVLGGLSDEDATAFRGHLVDCRACRTRVAELRSLADDLASAEREERAVQRLRTETRRDPDELAEEVSGDREPPRWRTVGLVVVIAILFAGLAMWNAHLRNENAQYAAVIETQERALDALGGGSLVPTETAEGVTGVVAVEGDRVVYVVAGLPDLDTAERLVVWLDEGQGLAAIDTLVPSRVVDGRLAAVMTRPEARELVLSVESMQVPAAPSTDPLLSATLER